MPQVSVQTDIDMPRGQLWDFVNDFDRMTEWVTFAEELTYLSDGEIGEGTIYREYGGVGPISSESEWEITRFDPPERQVHVGDLGIMQPELSTIFEEREKGTRFIQSLDFQAFPRVRPLGLLLETLFIKRAMRSGLRDSQANLKRLVESEG